MTGNVKKIRKPKPWKHPQPITKSQLMQMRDEFWDTAPHYGGRKGSVSLECYITYSQPFTRNFSKHKPLDTTPLLGGPKYWKPYRGGGLRRT